MMMEGKGIEMVDLGGGVTPEKFVAAAKEHNATIICLSALLTTTMGEMKNVVDAVKAQGLEGKVKVMIGGAPVTQAYCDQIGADCYTADAASAANAAIAFLTA
jgi:methanogenic corrinoid protein MtbC1